MMGTNKRRKEEVVTREESALLTSTSVYMAALSWTKGIGIVPRRIKVPIARNINHDKDVKKELYSLITVAEIPSEGLSGLGTKVIEEC